MKSKKSLVIILLVILLICGGAFAYVYFATDLLKSNAQIFGEYGDTVGYKMIDFFADYTMEDYYSQKSTNSYENSGIISLKAQSNGESYLDSYLNGDIDLSFKGASDVNTKNFQQEVTINYSDNEKFTFEFIKNDLTYALGSNEVVNKYIALKNENLNDFANKLGIDSSIEVPDSIEFNKSEWTVQKTDVVVNRYFNIIMDRLTKDNFSKENSSSYTVTIEKDNLKDIILSILKELKNDSDIMGLLGMEGDSSVYQDNIEKLIEETSNRDFSNTSVRINITKDKENDIIEVNIDIKADENKSNITISIENDQTIKIKQNYTRQYEDDISGETKTESNDVEYTITKESTDNRAKYTVTSKSNDGIFEIIVELDNVSDNGATEKFAITYDATDTKISVEYNNAVTFKDNVTITELNDDNSAVLNDYNADELNSLLQQLLIQIFSVNAQKIQSAYNF